LGYLVWCVDKTVRGILSMEFIIQSNHYSPQFMSNKIQGFLQTQQKIIQN